jgi:hypothetical protein
MVTVVYVQISDPVRRILVEPNEVEPLQGKWLHVLGVHTR